MPVFDDPESESLRLEGVRLGLFPAQLDTDITPENELEHIQADLIADLEKGGWHRSAALESRRMMHPEGRKPYSKPRPGVRKRRK